MLPPDMTARRLITLFLPLVVGLLARPVVAQQVDVVRGRISSAEGNAIEGAQITVTTLSGNVSRTSRTDSQGRFMLTVPGGDGDYMVQVAAIGFLAKRFELKRVADEDILVADAKLARNVTELEAVRIQAPRSRVARNDNSPDIGGGEQRVNASQLPADQMGDLAAMAASTPGTLLVPGADGDPSGFSVLGLGADQNSTTMNGQNIGASNLPRDAQVGGALATSPYDVSRGGFSGGNFNIRTRSGSNFVQRGSSVLFDAPSLQWTDAAARALGQEFSNVSLGGQLGGPLKYNEAFYNVAWQLGRRSNALQTLLNTDPVGLQAAGIAADSVARLVSLLNSLAVPTLPGRNITDRIGDQGSLFGTFDLAPPGARSGSSYNVTVNGSWSKQSPFSNLTTEMPAHAGERRDWNVGAQARHSGYYGFGLLSESTIGFNSSSNATTPFVGLPSGTVRIASAFADGSQGLKSVQFGGSQIAIQNTSQSVAFTNQLSWFSENNQHRVKLTSELRRDAFTIFQGINQYGSLSYNSLVDLGAGRPSFFSRQLSPREREGSELVAGLAIGDSWRVSPTFQLQFGVRLDANHFNVGPPENPQAEALLGVRNGATPNRIYASPRIGFSWTYGDAPQIAGFEGAFRGPRAVVRGGIGMFQGVSGAQALVPMFDNTGLAGGVQQVNCAGPAAPAANWSSWMSDPATIPATCAGGSPSFGSTVPNIALYANDFVAPRSLRANLQWSGPVLANRFSATFDVTWSRNLNQTGSLDRNFLGTQRFALAEEGNRPVFVDPMAIDPTTGAISALASRVTPLFNRVSESRSDLTSESRQVRVSINPTAFNTTLGWNLSYVYGEVREQVRGFGGSTSGNPNVVEWTRAGFDIRHQIQYSLFANLWDAVRISWNGSFRSPQPFTPLIAGDVNGDGYSNDRAFVVNPATSADPALAASMQSLLAQSPDYVRECLMRQLGGVAARNSCDGPWTAQANLSISFNPVKLALPQRAQLSFMINNPLGALDLALHGEKGVHGWGQQAFPDQNLLYVRGFNASTQRYTYEVNQRFGSANPLFSTFRAPVTLTAMMRFDFGPTREEQSLHQQLGLGRRLEGNRMPEGMLRAIYGNGGIVNPMATMLRQSDTLRLTVLQADSLATMNRRYAIRLDSIWSPVAKELAALPMEYDEAAAYRRYRTAREATVDLLKFYVGPIQSLITDAQRRKLPTLVASHLDFRFLDGIRSGTAGGGGGGSFGLGGGGATFAGGGGGGGGQQIIIR